MRFKTQDPKYDIEVAEGDAYLVNAATGRRIPKDVPVFMLVAKDKHAVGAMRDYADRCRNEEHVAAVESRIVDFENFIQNNRDRMKEPDTFTAS